MSPRYRWVADTVMATLSTRKLELIGRSTVTPSGLLSGINRLRPVREAEAEVMDSKFSQSKARFTASSASTKPAPYHGLNLIPALLFTQPESPVSIRRAVRIKISFTSRQPNVGLAWIIRAAIPATIGAEAEVPPNVLV